MVGNSANGPGARERQRQRQGMNGGGAESEGDTELEAGSRLRAVGTEPDVGLERLNCEIMTSVEVDA